MTSDYNELAVETFKLHMRIKEEIEIRGGNTKFKNLTLVSNIKFFFLGKLIKIPDFLNLTFDDSFN